MFDARIFTQELESTRTILNAKNAIFRGEYLIRDAIYAPTDPSTTIARTFLRLRYISKNIWDEKAYIVSIKNTEMRALGKRSHIPVRKEFDTEEAALLFIQENYADSFRFLYAFDRVGWQYDMGDEQVDLEDIQGNYSIEFKSPTEEGLAKLLTTFVASSPIRGPSVIAIQKLLGL